ncbi:MAG: MauE/DoxX family redox-associated membrane protein [Candidatus Binataceae bacterium]|jgi:uncharacterized membrane protein YphA (DoxX/SURF4 family)
MKLRAKTLRWIDLAIRLIVGGVFIYAGSLKIVEPLHFGDNIASFQILPNILVNSFALTLPIFEMLTGALLIIGWLRPAAAIGRPAALALVIVCGVFLIAVVSALARGLTIDCGCFGTGTPTRAKMWMDLARDFALFLGVLLVYLYPSARARGSFDS